MKTYVVLRMFLICLGHRVVDLYPSFLPVHDFEWLVVPRAGKFRERSTLSAFIHVHLQQRCGKSARRKEEKAKVAFYATHSTRKREHSVGTIGILLALLSRLLAPHRLLPVSWDRELENKEIVKDDPHAPIDDLTIYQSDYSFKFDLHPTFQHPRYVRPKLSAPETGPVEIPLFEGKEELQKALNKNLYVSLYQATYLPDPDTVLNDPRTLAEMEFKEYLAKKGKI
ncbi:hypothetical protein BC830DRAFT_1076762 [Chytriomyces sp. MP71]|nr:hypothetical protein BC830DRAFT_1076762 [Chytriomyces sp. MP71]